MLDELPPELLAPVLTRLAATDLSRVSRCCRSLCAAASAAAAMRVRCHRHALEPHAELPETWLWLAALLELEWAISAGGETTFLRGCDAGVVQACGNPGDGRLGLRSVVVDGPEPLGPHIAPGFTALLPEPLELGVQGNGDRWIPRLSGGQSVAAGSEHALLLRADGRLLACGNGFRGRLGNGDEDPRCVCARACRLPPPTHPSTPTHPPTRPPHTHTHLTIHN
jgi:hypothetical protein